MLPKRLKSCKLKRNRGQVLTEFAVMLAMLMGVVLMFVAVLALYSEYSWRVLRIIGLEYP